MRTDRVLRAGLLVGTSVAALGLAGALGPAKAFEEVEWTWTKDIVETVDIDIDIASTLTPAGLTQLEAVQIMVGDITATDSIGLVVNNQPGGGGGGDGQTLSGSFTFSTDNYEADGPGNGFNITNGGNVTDQTGALAGATVNVVGNVDEQGNELNFTANVEDIQASLVDGPGAPLDAATDLPEVSSSATALANQRSIESDTATMIHDAQFAFGGFAGDSGQFEAGVVGGVYENGSGNEHLSAALAMMAAGSLGMIEPANITATSTVGTIENASVTGQAQAFANVHSVDVGADANGILIADVTQAAYANVNATQSVGSVTVSNYTGLGTIDGPLVDSSALAVGNVSNITVGATPVDTQ